MLANHSEAIALILFSVCALLFLAFFAFERGKYLVIRMGVKINLNMIRQTVEDCFNKQFSQKISLKEVDIGPKSHLEFIVSISSDEKELYAQVEHQLSILLYERFGYSKPFSLIAKI